MKTMQKWQKIAGVVTFGAIGICELLLCANTYLDLKYIALDLYWPDEIERLYQRTNSLSSHLPYSFVYGGKEASDEKKRIKKILSQPQQKKLY